MRVTAQVVAGALSMTASLFVPLLFAGDDAIVLRGTVVSSVDRAPIRAALVQLLGEKPRVMLTDANGTFEFDGLPPGDAAIAVRKPGYFSAQEYYPKSVGEQRVHLAPNLQPLELKLYPEAVIYGRLTNENGRPLEGMTVQLVRSGVRPAGISHESLPSTTSNENGEYRLAELHAGTYLVAVSPSFQKMNAAFPDVMFQIAKFRTGYPSAFYPGVSDRAQATPLRLTPGRKVEADIRLTLQPLYRVSGIVQGSGGDGQIVVVLVNQHDVNPVAATTVTPGLNRFVLDGVPAGSYFLGALQEPAQGVGEQKTGISRIEVTQNTDVASVVIAEKETVQVRFRYESLQSVQAGFVPPAQVASLVRTDMPMTTELVVAALIPNQGNPDEGLPILLDPGSYRAVLNPQPNRCVASIKSGSMEILSGELTVAAGTPVDPIEVVVRGDCGTLQGTVAKDGQPAMGRVLLLTNDTARGGISAAANSDGTFAFKDLVPGKYWAVALDAGDDFDPGDRETLSKVQSLATEVDVPASAQQDVQLQLKSLQP